MGDGGDGEKGSPILRDFFGWAERGAYIAVGGLLILTTVVALIQTLFLLLRSVVDWHGSTDVFETVDQLLFVLMLVEILHTVSASVRTGTLTVQPFLIVGLIASVRRVLVITLEASKATAHGWSDAIHDQLIVSMIELGVLGLLILIMVFSIYLMHRIPPESKEAG